MLWLYRTLECDEDGDPFDHGLVRAETLTGAMDDVSGRLGEILGAGRSLVRFYPLMDVPTGVFPDAVDARGERLPIETASIDHHGGDR